MAGQYSYDVQVHLLSSDVYRICRPASGCTTWSMTELLDSAFSYLATCAIALSLQVGSQMKLCQSASLGPAIVWLESALA